MTRTCVDVVHGNVDAAMLDVKVGIDVHNGIVADFHTRILCILNGKLLDGRRIVGCIITGEITKVASQLHVQHLGDAELEVEVAVERYLRKGQSQRVAAGLVGDVVVPMEWSCLHVLAQGDGKNLDMTRSLANGNIVAKLLGQRMRDIFSQEGVLHGQIGVVLEVLEAYLYRCAYARQGECATDASPELL